MNISYQVTPLQYRLKYCIEHCILAIAFFLPLSLTITSLFLAGGTVLWFGKMIAARRMELRRSPFDILVILLVVFSAASIWGSPDRGFSFYNYYHLMGRYVLLYYLVINNVQSPQQVRRLVLTVLFSAGVVAAYGFYQYVHGVDMAFGWVDGDQFPDLKVRVFSTLQNPNLLAGYLVVMIAVAAGIGCNANHRGEKALFFALVLALGVCLVLTYSRGAWISVLALIIAFGVLKNRKILWLLALIPVTMVIGHELVMDRLLSIMNPTDTSSTLRLALWESTIAMITGHPWLGIGWGAYWMVYPEYDFFVLNANTKILHAHNMYLHIAAEIGLPGFLTFLGILCGHAYSAYRLAARATDRWSAGLMLGVVGAMVSIAVGGLTDYVLFSIQMSMLFWLLNSLVIVLYLAEGHRQPLNLVNKNHKM
ncbi:MAG: O-antigen ligase family protein [Negativicutes bacterium]|nr:O-antigen ligase family protein [Negativicutes bacterium]